MDKADVEMVREAVQSLPLRAVNDILSSATDCALLELSVDEQDLRNEWIERLSALLQAEAGGEAPTTWMLIHAPYRLRIQAAKDVLAPAGVSL